METFLRPLSRNYLCVFIKTSAHPEHTGSYFIGTTCSTVQLDHWSTLGFLLKKCFCVCIFTSSVDWFQIAWMPLPACVAQMMNNKHVLSWFVLHQWSPFIMIKTPGLNIHGAAGANAPLLYTCSWQIAQWSDRYIQPGFFSLTVENSLPPCFFLFFFSDLFKSK